MSSRPAARTGSKATTRTCASSADLRSLRLEFLHFPGRSLTVAARWAALFVIQSRDRQGSGFVTILCDPSIVPYNAAHGGLSIRAPQAGEEPRVHNCRRGPVGARRG